MANGTGKFSLTGKDLSTKKTKTETDTPTKDSKPIPQMEGDSKFGRGRYSTGWIRKGQGSAEKIVRTRKGVTKIKTRKTTDTGTVFTKEKYTEGGFKFVDVKRTKTGGGSGISKIWKPVTVKKEKTKTGKRGGFTSKESGFTF